MKINTQKLNIVAYVHMFPPQHNAGSETTLLSLLRGMVRRGHKASVLAAEVDHDYEIDGVHVFGQRIDQPEFARRMFGDADVAMTHLNCTGSAMRAARDTAKPLVHLVHNHRQLKFHQVRPIRAQLLIFNSEWVRKASPMDPSMVVYPIVEKDLYATERGEFATRTTFVNLTVSKGANVFYEAARRLQEIEFLGVQGAYGEQYVPQEVMRNVTIWDHTPDIKHVYRCSKVILMPSDYESYGRIAVEAACTGIPSIVHPTDGLKEALGPAGIYCDRTKIEEWVAEIRRLYSDDVYYAERSAAALELANSFQPEREFDRVEMALQIVAKAGLTGGAWTVDALGEEAYLRLALEGGHFDPRREPRSYRPALGDTTMKRRPYKSTRKLCVGSSGKAVEADSPDRQFILCGPGQEIPFDRAVLLGLVDAETGQEVYPLGAEPEAKQIAGPAENKAILAPEENKGPGGRKRRGARRPAGEVAGPQGALPTTPEAESLTEEPVLV